MPPFDLEGLEKLQMRSIVAGVLIGVSSICSIAIAADSATSNSPTSAPTGLLMAFAIVYFSRRAKIGGWLLYYYIQLYISLLISLVFAPTILRQLNPSTWDTSARYVWYLLSVAPLEIGIFAEATLATVLLWRRNEGLVQKLRQVLLGLVVVSAGATAIDYAQFNEQPNMAMDLMTLTSSMIWCAYFYRSTRVMRVFVYQNFVFAEEAPRKETSEEKRYRLKRALISAAILFLLTLLLFGVAQEGAKKPDPVFLFGVPGFYGFVAFAIGYAVPITKKKRKALIGALPE
jgi:hypothetical protein